ncbi:hypothetical protein GCM10025734_18060 [Kitasatospora paranensis]
MPANAVDLALRVVGELPMGWGSLSHADRRRGLWAGAVDAWMGTDGARARDRSFRTIRGARILRPNTAPTAELMTRHLWGGGPSVGG